MCSGAAAGSGEEEAAPGHCTVLYCTVLYCTVLYWTVLCCTVLYLARTRETEQVSEQALASHGATQCSCLREQRAPSSRGRHGPGSTRLTHSTMARMAAGDVMKSGALKYILI